jgi:hypothetical protein
VEGDRIILKWHNEEANSKLEEADAPAFAREDRECRQREEHEQRLRDAAKRITFD